MAHLTHRRLVLACSTTLAIGLGAGFYARAAMTVPGGISYSGTLKNHGVADDSPHDFVFELHDGTSVVCTDTRSALAVSNGRFDVSNLFASSCDLDGFLSGAAPLSVRITVDGQLLSPAQPLGTVPYAARARRAEATASASVKATTHFSGTATSHTNVGHSIALPEKGKYLVFYTGICSRQGGSRGDQSYVHLRWSTGDFRVPITGNFSTSSQVTNANVAITIPVSVDGPDTIQVQVHDNGAGGTIGCGADNVLSWIQVH